MLVDHLRRIVADEPSGLSLCVGGLDDLIETRALLDRIEVVCLVELARVDRAGEAESLSSLSTSDWFAAECRRTRKDARGMVGFAKKLVWAGSLADRVGDGTVSLAQARVIVAALTRKTISLFIDFETELYALLPTITVDELAITMARWKLYADEATASDDIRSAEETRAAFLSKFGPHNMFALNATLTAEQGEVLTAAIDAIMQDDWEGNEETRTMPQRRADALAELGRHWLSTSESGTSHGAAPHIDVEVQLDDLMELADRSSFYREFVHADPANALLRHAKQWAGGLGGTTPVGACIDGVTVDRFCCDAFLRFVLRDGPVVLHAGNPSRTIPPGLRRLVISRDKRCRYPGCNCKASLCEIHHVRDWRKGGTHDINNLVLLCHKHHQRVHRFHEILILHADGRLEVQSSATGLLRTRSSYPPPTAGDSGIKPKKRHRRRNERVLNQEFVTRKQSFFNDAFKLLTDAYFYNERDFEAEEAFFQQRVNEFLLEIEQLSLPSNPIDIVGQSE
jgi:Domain of unknown function (DUF222)/HNH endonuclease